MFEAGFFGTIEDLFLGAKGGVTNMGRTIEDVFNTRRNSSEGDKEDHICDFSQEEIAEAEKDFPGLFETLSTVENGRKCIQECIKELFSTENRTGAVLFTQSCVTKILSQEGGLDKLIENISKVYQNEDTKYIKELICKEISKSRYWTGLIHKASNSISDTDFMKGLKENPLQYFEMSDDIKNIISNIDSGKISPEKGLEMLKQLPNPNIVLDMRKLIDDADSFMKAMKEEPESVSEWPDDFDEKKDTLTLEEAITSTGIGKRLFSRMEETPAVAG